VNRAQYRPDIDGLRAVAVVPVMLFHADISLFSGGYIGVDVFFVISGYLITSLLLRDMGKSTFSIVSFWERRIRRLFPALVALLVVLTCAAIATLLPNDLRRLSDSLISTASATSNVLFWLKSGYFEKAAEQHPLLHTWSLAVEEQFYLLFPWLLLFLVRRRLPIARALALLAGLSLAICVASTLRSPSAAFYLPHARAWELLTGALLACPSRWVGTITQGFRNAIGAIGLLGLALAFVLFDRSTAFPGIAAAAPVLATGALLVAGSGQGSLVSRLLSLAPLNWVGRISYSLYLWHWPILVFGRYLRIGPPPVGFVVLELSLSVALAAASYYLVERPIRAATVLRSRRATFLAAAGSVGLLIGVGTLLRVLGGLPQRFDHDVVRLAEGEDDVDPRREKCMGTPPNRMVLGNLCRLGSNSNAPEFLVWGDSHAMAIAEAVSIAAIGGGRGGVVASSGTCPPILGVEFDSTNPAVQSCADRNRSVVRMLENSSIKTVFLVASWISEMEGRTSPVGTMIDAETGYSSPNSNSKVLALGIERTVSTVSGQGKRVIFVHAVPGAKAIVPSSAARARAWGREVPLEYSREEYERRVAPLEELTTRLSSRFGMGMIRPGEALCGSGMCRAVEGDAALYSDSHHLTLSGARLLSPLFDPAFGG